MDIFSPDSFAKAGSPPPTFIGLVFALGGWALIETVLLSMHLALPGHLIPTVMGLYLTSTSVRRLRTSRPFAQEEAAPPASQRGSSPAAQAGWATFLLLAGACIGLLVLAGSALLLGLAASALTFAPWNRIPLCRDRIISASALACTGLGLSFLVPHHPFDPIFLLIAGWLLWISALYAVIGRIAKQWRVERDFKAATHATSTRIA